MRNFQTVKLLRVVGFITIYNKIEISMKHIKLFEQFIRNKSQELDEAYEEIQEGMDPNDPVLVAIRASKEDRKKKVTAQKERMKKRVYGKQREKLEVDLWTISIDLKDAYAERRNIYNDMESEAGEKGDEWSDDDANRYGSRLNLVDDEIESLLKKRQEIEIKLAY
jgi:predicted RND superfamily exporter protein